ncbi:MAG: hypothetical protein WAN46_00055 [Gammaproteobacteria bacterium]
MVALIGDGSCGHRGDNSFEPSGKHVGHERGGGAEIEGDAGRCVEGAHRPGSQRFSARQALAIDGAELAEDLAYTAIVGQALANLRHVGLGHIIPLRPGASAAYGQIVLRPVAPSTQAARLAAALVEGDKRAVQKNM